MALNEEDETLRREGGGYHASHQGDLKLPGSSTTSKAIVRCLKFNPKSRSSNGEEGPCKYLGNRFRTNIFIIKRNGTLRERGTSICQRINLRIIRSWNMVVGNASTKWKMSDPVVKIYAFDGAC